MVKQSCLSTLDLKGNSTLNAPYTLEKKRKIHLLPSPSQHIRVQGAFFESTADEKLNLESFKWLFCRPAVFKADYGYVVCPLPDCQHWPLSCEAALWQITRPGVAAQLGRRGEELPDSAGNSESSELSIPRNSLIFVKVLKVEIKYWNTVCVTFSFLVETTTFSLFKRHQSNVKIPITISHFTRLQTASTNSTKFKIIWSMTQKNEIFPLKKLIPVNY